MSHPIFLSVFIFVLAYVWLISEKSPRYVIVLTASIAMILARVLTPGQALDQINWDTILILMASFILVEALSYSGFFESTAETLLIRLNYNPVKVFFFFPILAGLLAMFLNNITVMLFLAALSLEICAVVPLAPGLLITAEVCAANMGGASTLIGSPPNLLMGTMLHYGFDRVMVHMIPAMWLPTLVLLAVYYLLHRRAIHGATANLRPRLPSSHGHPRVTRAALLALGTMVGLLVFGPSCAARLHWRFWMGGAAMGPALLLVFYQLPHRGDVVHRIDFESLVFFLGLFVMVGGLATSGLFRLLAVSLQGIQSPLMLAIGLLWLAALASALVDNIPMAIAIAYLIRELGHLTALPESLLVWSALMGLSIGGNMTPIGASPNVVAYTVLERTGFPVGWKKWIGLTAPPTLAAMAAATFVVWVTYAKGWY